MTNYLNCNNSLPPSYSGVTINIMNPALNIPPSNAVRMPNSVGMRQEYTGINNPVLTRTNAMQQDATSNGNYMPMNADISSQKLPSAGNYQSQPIDGNYMQPVTSAAVEQQYNYGLNQAYSGDNFYQQNPKDVNSVNEVKDDRYPLNPNIQPAIYAQNPQSVYYSEPNSYYYGQNPQYAGQPVSNYSIEQNPQSINSQSALSDTEQSDKAFQTEHASGSYNSGTQNINTTNIYQTVPADYNNPQQAYPQEYYLNNYQPVQSGNSAEQPYAVNPHDDNSGVPQMYDNYDKTAAEETENKTSQEIINNLSERQEQEKILEQSGKKTKVVSLTNEYIMSLENYLNNPNTDIRLMAAKEILTRLDEDRSRYDDAALNALLNKMLQDPNKLVRIAAMSALASELACGNDYTVELLTKIQQNPNADPEDVLEASQILLKRASSTEIRYIPAYNQQQRTEE